MNIWHCLEKSPLFGPPFPEQNGSLKSACESHWDRKKLRHSQTLSNRGCYQKNWTLLCPSWKYPWQTIANDWLPRKQRLLIQITKIAYFNNRDWNSSTAKQTLLAKVNMNYLSSSTGGTVWSNFDGAVWAVFPGICQLIKKEL
jgi:hypothetical protein